MLNKLFKVFSYIFVALLASTLTLAVVYATDSQAAGWRTMALQAGDSKLYRLLGLMNEKFIEDVDTVALEDAAAEAMIDAAGDRWSHYISAAEYPSYVERGENAYVGIGITIVSSKEPAGFEILAVTEGGPAQEAGIQPHDVLIRIEGRNCSEMDLNDTKNLMRGEAGTEVHLAVDRDGQELDFTVMRERFEQSVATYEMLPSGYGLITIKNFDSKCADETIVAIDALQEAGAKGLIFDVRFNPGGYKSELVEVLDYLLPEGPLFRSETYDGKVTVDTSDASYVDLPMAVLVNGDSYSAAEFFAAALQEYDAAVIVGQETCGKGYFQNTFQLGDGSAAAISVGKYYTPNGVSLAGVGITPDVPVEVDDKTYAQISLGLLEPADDPQLQAAVSALEGAE